MVPTVEERVARLEEQVNGMDADAKLHFAELREFIGEQIGQLRGEFGLKLNLVFASILLLALAVGGAALMVL